jgi:hypothetical protein
VTAVLTVIRGEKQPAWDYRFRAKAAVIDGDTLRLPVVDLGLRVNVEIVVRLAGCNAAEKTTVDGQRAATFVQRWLAECADPDGWVAVTTHAVPGDKYGRWLAEVTDLAGGRDLVTDLIAAGLAVAWSGHGPSRCLTLRPEPCLGIGCRGDASTASCGVSRSTSRSSPAARPGDACSRGRSGWRARCPTAHPIR